MNEPVLDGKVPAIILTLIARDGVVTKDVYVVSTKGAVFAGKILLQDGHP
jgi:hypothetical protein